MRAISIFLLGLALGGCDGLRDDIPKGPDTGFRNGDRVEVTKAGTIKWNNMVVTDAELTTFVRQYAALPKGAGPLWAEFEPGAPLDRAMFVRKQIVGSGLCRQRRCVEGTWGVERPVVN
ncbi:MAG: hypothetical protein WAO77_03550 [Sphingobium sp.]|uniref:hypothetical protein n=1 Tax=Sphingobium sp. TaxID=1912891 RepID=UPI003BB1F210